MKTLLLILLFPLSGFSDAADVRVVTVHDADTLVVLHNGRAETIRLKGVECPEAGEAGSLRAKKYAADMIAGKHVTLKKYGQDKYGRTIADLFLENGTLFNKDLVRSGNCKWGRSRAMRD